MIVVVLESREVEFKSIIISQKYTCKLQFWGAKQQDIQ